MWGGEKGETERQEKGHYRREDPVEKDFQRQSKEVWLRNVS